MIIWQLAGPLGRYVQGAVELVRQVLERDKPGQFHDRESMGSVSIDFS
jgi:hypothetical protein